MISSKTSKSGKPVFIALIVSLGGFLFGFDASVISGVIGFVTPQFDLSVIQKGWVVSSPSFAAMFAMLLAGVISDRIGRKRVLQHAAFLYTISAIFSAIAPNYEILVVARMLGGLAFGAALVIAPIYIGEVAPPDKRGKLVSIQQLNIVIGFSASYFSNYFLLETMGSQVFELNEYNIWRWMLGIEAVPAILYFALLFLVPRSPRWLFRQGKTEEASDILRKLYPSESIDKEIQVIQQNLNKNNATPWWQFGLLFRPEMKLILALGLIIGIVQQITGVNAIFFYAATIFEQSGVGTNAAFAQAIYIGLINVAFTLLAMIFIDRTGRKPLMLIGLAGVVVSMAVTAYGFSQATYTITREDLSALPAEIDASKMDRIVGVIYYSDVKFKNELKRIYGERTFNKYEGDIIQVAGKMNAMLILIGILFFVTSFAFSLGPVMWVLFSEIFPARIRGLAVAFFGFVNSGTSTFVQFIFPWEVSALGNAASFTLFGLFGVVGFLLLWKLLPETKGKSLEQIEKEIIIR